VESLQTKKPKKIKTRRVKTEEEKMAARERLAAAREKRLKNNPPEYKNVHADVLGLEAEHPWSYKNVRQYIKHQREILAQQARDFKRGVTTSEAAVISTQCYINNMETYLKTNVWLDMYWGENRNNKVGHVCETPSYHHSGRHEGLIKRTPGVFYRDTGMVHKEDYTCED
jgi:hypothetical protein